MQNSLQSLWAKSMRVRVFSAVFLVVLLVWHGATWFFTIPKFLLPTPGQVLDAIIKEPMWFADATYYTLSATLIGFGIAVVVGVLTAMLIASSRVIEQTVYALLVAFNSVPKVAIAPLLLIWIGTGMESKIVMAAVIAVFPIIVDTALGLRSIEPDTIDLARSLGGRTWGIMFKIRLPSAMPSLFAGMKVAISFALIGAIVGEFVSSSRGLGYIIMTAQSSFQTERIFAALLILGLCGTVLFFFLDLLERLTLPWHISHRRNGLDAT